MSLSITCRVSGSVCIQATGGRGVQVSTLDLPEPVPAPCTGVLALLQVVQVPAPDLPEPIPAPCTRVLTLLQAVQVPAPDPPEPIPAPGFSICFR